MMQVAYLSSLVLQYIVAVNSNGSHSQLDTLEDYRIQLFPFSEETVIEYNMSDIETISNRVFQLTIPQANVTHNGTYNFSAGE